MAEERTVIIDVDLDAKDFDQEIGEVNTQLKKNREEIKELSKDYETNATEIAKLEQTNKKLSASKRELTKQSDIENNSLNALRIQLAEQTKERNNLNVATDEGAARFEELQTSIKGLNDQISGFEQAGGDFRRNVGNYPNLLKDAVGGINVFGTSLGNLFKTIVANPIGILIAALTSLVAVFAKSQTGIEFFRTASAALNTGLAKLADVVELLGAKMIKAFEDPKQTIIDLKDAIVDNVISYFTEFIPNAINKTLEGFGLLGDAVSKLFEGDFSGALDTATDASVKLLDGLTDLNPATALIKAGFEAAVPAIASFSEEVATAVGEAGRLEEALIANEKAQADLEVQRARSLAQLKELNLLIEDQTAGDEERLAAAQEAAAIEEELLQRSIELKKEELDIITAQNELANSTEEDVQRRRDAEIEYYNIQAESLERSVTLQNKENTIRAGIAKKQEAQRKKDSKALKAIGNQAIKDSQEEIKRQEVLTETKKQLNEQGLIDLSNALGTQSKLGKTFAATQIAADSARGVSGAIAAGAGIPFPANLGAIATGVTTVISGIARATSLLGSSAPSVGSISGADSAASSGLNLGLGNEASQSAANQQSFQNSISNMPAPQVAVTDIAEAADNRQVAVGEATI